MSNVLDISITTEAYGDTSSLSCFTQQPRAAWPTFSMSIVSGKEEEHQTGCQQSNMYGKAHPVKCIKYVYDV